MVDFLLEWGREIALAVLMAILAAVWAPIRKRVLWLWEWTWAYLTGLPKYISLRAFILKREQTLLFKKNKARVSLDNCPPAISLLNFKGGVGKTTIAANLAAAFATRYNRRVLIVDLDYQGSLSQKLLAADSRVMPIVNRWLTEKPLGRKQLHEDPKEVHKGIRLATCDYALTIAEDNLLLRWLLQDHRRDARLKFARWLSNPKTKAKAAFDLIIFDAPPRLGIAAANGLAASRLVIIPHRPDPLSVQPVAPLLNTLATFQSYTSTTFRIGGLVTNMTHQAAELTAGEAESCAPLDALQVHRYRTIIPDTPNIGRVQQLAYFQEPRSGPSPRAIFDALADEIAEQLGFPAPSSEEPRSSASSVHAQE